jgi:uncharacterized phage infection (PIP) family protein YhgE
MAATTGSASALLVPPSAAPTSVKTMEQLMSEIDQAKKDIETETKALEKIDTGRKKAAANRDRSVEGRTKIRQLTEHVATLKQQMEFMTSESDPKWPVKTFDKTKKAALKTLENLTHKLEHADKHLEKVTKTIPATTAPLTTDTQSAAAAPIATTEGENTKGLGALLSRDPITGRKSSTATELPAISTSAKLVDETAPKTTKREVASDEDDDGEEEDDDDDDGDVISDRKRG